MNETEHEVFDIYVIPPNFIDEGSVVGGMFKLRNAAEAAVLLAVIGLPVLRLPLTLTGRIIVLCLTALPAVIFALVGVYGESLFSFIAHFFRFLRNRRVLVRSDRIEQLEATEEHPLKNRIKQKISALWGQLKKQRPAFAKKPRRKDVKRRAARSKKPVQQRAKTAKAPSGKQTARRKGGTRHLVHKGRPVSENRRG